MSDHRVQENFPLEGFINGDIKPAIGACQAGGSLRTSTRPTLNLLLLLLLLLLLAWGY